MKKVKNSEDKFQYCMWCDYHLGGADWRQGSNFENKHLPAVNKLVRYMSGKFCLFVYTLLKTW